MISRDENYGYYWIIGGGILQVPLIDEVHKLGYKVIVSDRDPNCVCRTLADVFFAIDIFDISNHIKTANHFISSGKKIVAVLAAGIDAPETMAMLATNLGLPSVDPKIAHIVNNKNEFRKALLKLGYPVPKFRVIEKDNIVDLNKIIDEIGYPLIVKNTDSSGSRGTRIFYQPDIEGIKHSLRSAMKVSRSRKALIEECLDGPEQTVETLFDVNGNFHPCFITDRIFDRSNGYALEVGLRHPSKLPEKIQKEMYELAKNVARDLGIRIGAAKFDMMLTKDGPRIIEMTVRLSGGFDSQYLVPAATGKNVLLAAIFTSLGKPFSEDLLLDKKHRIGLTASIWPEPGKIISMEGIDEAKKVPGFEYIFFRYGIGDTIESYVDCTKRVCFIIITGQTEEEADSSLRKIKELIHIQTQRI